MTQRPTITVRDPDGTIRATLPSSAGPEALLRAALGMSPRDELMVLARDDDTWDLAVMWTTGHIKVQPLNVQCGHVPDRHIAANRDGMIQTAWLNMLDGGWSVA